MRFSYFWSPNILTPDDCDSIIETYEPQVHPSTTFTHGEGTTGDEARKSNVVFIQDPEIKRVVATAVSQVNRYAFGFNIDLTEFDLQFTQYKAEDEGHYDWHIDTIPESVKGPHTPFFTRKVSTTILLSAADDFEGGNLEILSEHIPKEARQKGAGIFFPSFMGHRVSPVTKGTRYSLVAWIEGPHFK